MTVTPLGRDQDCSLKNREPDVPAPWFLDPGGWSKTAAVSLYFIFPGICTLSLTLKPDQPKKPTLILKPEPVKETHFSPETRTKKHTLTLRPEPKKHILALEPEPVK
ncbi:hypothetical protein STEG23_021459 [Scotinomys teguina]